MSSATPPVPSINHDVLRKLDCLRVSSNVGMVASVVCLLATAIFIGLASASYIPPLTPLCSLGAFIVLLIPTIILDCCLRSTAHKHHYDLRAYMQARQPKPPPPPSPERTNPSV